MRATLDGEIILEDQQLTISSWQREAVERTAAGLDGVLSIDLGIRSRELVQNGILRAVSEEALKEKIDAISELMDGQIHALVSQGGEQFDNLRVDAFKTGQRDYSGRGVVCEFEIIYTQLRDS